MANLINIVFTNGTPPVEAAQLNAIVSAINTQIAEFNALNQQYATLNKSKEIVRAYKNTEQALTMNGAANTIQNWVSELNIGTALNVSTGVTTIPETGIYRADLKAFISASNASRIRCKLSIVGSGTELGKAENNSYGTVTTISNYRQDLYCFGQVSMSAGVTIVPRIQVWDADSGKILAESSYDTTFILTRIF